MHLPYARRGERDMPDSLNPWPTNEDHLTKRCPTCRSRKQRRRRWLRAPYPFELAPCDDRWHEEEK